MPSSVTESREYKRGKYHCTVDLLSDWFGISCMTIDNFCFYLQNRLIQTSQQEVNSTVILPPLVFPAESYPKVPFGKTPFITNKKKQILKVFHPCFIFLIESLNMAFGHFSNVILSQCQGGFEP
jgi:hypothetical protein